MARRRTGDRSPVLATLSESRVIDPTQHRRLVIAGGQQGKGRSFHAVMLASIEADAMWSNGDSPNERPVWMMIAASEESMRPFLANLRLGRQAILGGMSGYRKKGEVVELLKSAGYAFTTQRHEGDSIVTAYLPHLFDLDPGAHDPERVRFICAPSRRWLSQQRVDVRPAVAWQLDRLPPKWTKDLTPRLPELAVLAHLFAAYVDRRTRVPIIADARFYLQLLVAMLRERLATFPCGDSYRWRDYFGRSGDERQLQVRGVECVGLSEPIACNASQSDFNTLLAAEVALWFRGQP